MPDFATLSVTYHGALLLGAIAAYNKYGDRTDVTDKSLKGTKEALDTLLAYLGRSMAEAVRPTIEGILANAADADGIVKELRAVDIVEELRGEAFVDDVASFVNRDADELLSYRNLVHARARWSAWAKRIRLGRFRPTDRAGTFHILFRGRQDARPRRDTASSADHVHRLGYDCWVLRYVRWSDAPLS